MLFRSILLCPHSPSCIEYAPTRRWGFHRLSCVDYAQTRRWKPHLSSNSLYAPLSRPPHPTPSHHQPFGTGVGGEIDHASSVDVNALSGDCEIEDLKDPCRYRLSPRVKPRKCSAVGGCLTSIFFTLTPSSMQTTHFWIAQGSPQTSS